MEHARPPSELSLEGGPAQRAAAWRKWQQQFIVFLKASGVNKEDTSIQASLLVNLIGSEGYDVYTTFKFVKDENKEDIDVLLKKFNDHFGTKENTTMCRFKFFSRHQETGESIDEYVTVLKLLAQHCEFEHLEESLIRDRIVCGVCDGKVRDRLLRAEELTLHKAVKICQASEMSKEEKQQIEDTKNRGVDERMSSVAVDVVQRYRSTQDRGMRTARSAQRGGGRQPPATSAGAGGSGGRYSSSRAGYNLRPCASCGSVRCNGGYRCAAKYSKCFLCNVNGHFKKMCPLIKSKKVYEIEENKYGVNVREEYTTSVNVDEDLYYVSTIDGNNVKDNSCKWYETLTLFNTCKRQVFKLDTGSDLNVLSVSNYLNLGLSLISLQNNNIKAQSFCGNTIPFVGSCYIDWLYKGRVYNLLFVVCKYDCQSVLGKHACESLGIIKRVLSVNIDQYSDLFHGLGKLPGQYKIVIDKCAQPSVCAVRKIPLGVRDKLLSELIRMERMGVIRKVSHPTAWVNAIVVVAKKDGSIRLDPRPLNRVVQRARYPLPSLTEIATKLQGARYFSKLDARSGYWIVEIDNDSADLCTFGTPFGRYQFLRLPYGINCASEVFHAKVRQIFEDIQRVDSFVDDIIVWGSNMREHDERLERVLERARQVGIKFNKEKCEFRATSVTYLGHTFSEEGMQIDKNKIKAITDMPMPHDRRALERFLGMINYLARFIPNYSEIASPLRSLLKKDVTWCWDAQHDQAAERLKNLVCSAPVLSLYAASEPVTLSVDASSHALGAALLQAGRPVEFASCTLSDTQKRYAQIEKELLAIVFALERFHQYVFGRGDVIVESDHKPLEALFNKPLDAVPARLQRMMLRIQGYEFKVIYKPGKYMNVADTLSRAPLLDIMKDNISEEVTDQSCFIIENVRFSSEKMRLIKNAVQRDKQCQTIIAYILNGWPENKYQVDECARECWSYREYFEYIDGIILKDNLVFIPSSLRSEMVGRVHDGHMGIDRCKRHARDVMFWPGMSRDIERAVRRCAVCAERVQRPPREPLLSHFIPNIPWAKVGSDIFQYRNNYFLILVDYFSNYIEVNKLNNIGSKAVIEAMKEQFARHGIPVELVSDNGPAYASKEFRLFREHWGFKHTTTSPNYAQSNGRSERSVQTIKNMLVKSIESHSDFHLGLLNLRATPRDGVSCPAEMLMGRRLNTRLPVHEKRLQPARDNSQDYTSIVNKQATSKQYYDRGSRALPELEPGDRVVMLEAGKRKHARVQTQAPEPRSYFVTDTSGHRYRRNRRHLVKAAADDSNKRTLDADKWSSAKSDVGEAGGATQSNQADSDAYSTPPLTASESDSSDNSNTKNKKVYRRPAAEYARVKIKELIKKQCD